MRGSVASAAKASFSAAFCAQYAIPEDMARSLDATGGPRAHLGARVPSLSTSGRTDARQPTSSAAPRRRQRSLNYHQISSQLRAVCGGFGFGDGNNKPEGTEVGQQSVHSSSESYRRRTFWPMDTSHPRSTMARWAQQPKPPTIDVLRTFGWQIVGGVKWQTTER